jgi:hypothetical protein
MKNIDNLEVAGSLFGSVDVSIGRIEGFQAWVTVEWQAVDGVVSLKSYEGFKNDEDTDAYLEDVELEIAEELEKRGYEIDNISSCAICGAKVSFERHSEELPPEYDVCTECGIRVCPDCARYGDGESPYCKNCLA